MPVTHPLAPFRRGVSRVLRRRPRLTDAIDWMYRLPVITITRRHPPYTSRVALTSYRKKIPRIACRTCTVHVRALGKRAIFRHAHGHAYTAGGRRVSTSTYPRRKRYRHPRPHCALGASANSDPDTLHRSRGSHHQPQAVERPAVLLRAIRRSAPPLSPPSSRPMQYPSRTLPKRKPLPTRRIRLKGVQWGLFGKPRNARL